MCNIVELSGLFVCLAELVKFFLGGGGGGGRAEKMSGLRFPGRGISTQTDIMTFNIKQLEMACNDTTAREFTMM